MSKYPTPVYSHANAVMHLGLANMAALCDCGKPTVCAMTHHAVNCPFRFVMEGASILADAAWHEDLKNKLGGALIPADDAVALTDFARAEIRVLATGDFPSGFFDGVAKATTSATGATTSARPWGAMKIGTEYLDRFRDALGVMCFYRPDIELCRQWLNHENEKLQDWVLEHMQASIGWAQGIGVIDAAHVLANNPQEGEDLGHEGYTSETRRAMNQQVAENFDRLAEIVGWTKERCEQTGESPFDVAEALVEKAKGKS